MATTADYQAELRSTLVGAGTDYPLVGPIDGLVGMPVTAADVQPNTYPGTVRAADRARGRVLTLPVGIDKTTAADTSDALQSLVTAWRPSTSDLPLEVRIPGTSWTRTFYGRPRLTQSAADLAHLRASWASVDLDFHCSDPLAYSAQQSLAGATGTFNLNPGGSVGTQNRRVTLLFDGNANAPELVHNGNGGRIALNLVGASDYAVVHLWSGYVGVGPLFADVATPDLIRRSCTWLSLDGGVNNSLTVTGCTSVTIFYLPAWW